MADTNNPKAIADIPAAAYLISDGNVAQFGDSVVRDIRKAEEIRAQRRDNPRVQQLILRQRAAEREAALLAEIEALRTQVESSGKPYAWAVSGCGTPFYAEVTHWMSLPPPPER